MRIRSRQLEQEVQKHTQELQEANAMLEAQREASMDSILVVDEQRQVIYYNQQFLQIWRIPEDLAEQGNDNTLVEFVLPQLQDPDEFVNELKKIINDPRIKFSYEETPVESIVAPFNTDLFKVIEQEVSNVYPNAVTLPHLIIYGTDSRFFRKKGAICYGFFPGPVTMEEYRTIHGKNERVREESFRNAGRIYYNVVMNFCKEK